LRPHLRCLRSLPLLSRKQQLEAVHLPVVDAYALYVDHTRGAGTDLYQLACRFDLEGIVAKRADRLYDDHATTATWIQIVNPGYSQKVGRGELFTRAGKTGFP